MSERNVMQIEAELRAARQKLEEAEAVLTALRQGEADAIVVETQAGPRVYALASADEPYRVIVENLKEGAATITSDGLILYCNEAFARMAGRAPSNLVASNLSEIIGAGALALLTADGGSPGHEITLRRSDGQRLAWQVSSTPHATDSQTIFCLLATDLTRQLLRQRYEAMVEAVAEAVFMLTPDLRIETWSPGAERILGYATAEIIDRPERNLCQAEEPGLGALAALVAETGQPASADLRLKRKDGSSVEVLLHLAPLKDPANAITGYAAIAHDISERKRADEALRARELRLRLAMNAANAGSWEYDPDTDEITVSDSAAAFYGASPATHLTPEQVLAALYPDDRASVKEAVRESIVNKTPLRLELRAPQPDGSLRWLALYAELQLISDRMRLIGLAQDITEQKSAERERELLLREVNHRSKNMLGVVQAIASQTATASPNDFIERFSQRLRALAANQDLLVKSSWQGVDLCSLVRSQLAHFADTIGTRIQLEGPPLRISASAAQTIGMALHELATNASKYGAFSDDAGQLAIGWRIEQTPSSDRFELSWTESGGPPVEKPSRFGFGRTVIERMPRMQLEADVQLEYPATGVRWRLNCAARKIFEHGSALNG